MARAPLCPYCDTVAELVSGGVIYPHRRDLILKKFWRCPICQDCYVGCHPGTSEPLGRLANSELRRWKRAAHAAFDPLWRHTNGSKNKRGRLREAAYAALAQALGIPRNECHIGMFTVELCQRAIEAVPQLRQQLSGGHA